MDPDVPNRNFIIIYIKLSSIFESLILGLEEGMEPFSYESVGVSLMVILSLN